MTNTTVSPVRLAGRLPKGEANGLDSLLASLLSEPGRRRYAVVAYDVAEINTVVGEEEDDPDQRFPTIKIRSFEPVVSQADIDALVKIHQSSFSERTGVLTLPEDGDAEPAKGEDA